MERLSWNAATPPSTRTTKFPQAFAAQLNCFDDRLLGIAPASTIQPCQSMQRLIAHLPLWSNCCSKFFEYTCRERLQYFSVLYCCALEATNY